MSCWRKQKVYLLCQAEVLFGETAGVMGGESQADAAVTNVNVWMMAGFLCQICDTVHELNRCGKVFEFKCSYKLIALDTPGW